MRRWPKIACQDFGDAALRRREISRGQICRHVRTRYGSVSRVFFEGGYVIVIFQNKGDACSIRVSMVLMENYRVKYIFLIIFKLFKTMFVMGYCVAMSRDISFEYCCHSDFIRICSTFVQ